MQKQLSKPALCRSGAEYDLFAGPPSTPLMTETLSKSDSELFAKPLPITSARVAFPAETEKLEEAIKQHTTRIEIHIPRAGSYLSEQKEVCPLNYDPTGVLKIKQLCIKHSIGNERGYWRTALEALMPFICSAQNLQQITLSHGIVEELLPIIAKKTKIIVDCSCAYTPTDTIYPQEYLNAIREIEAAEIVEKYPDRNILVLKAANTEDLFSKGKF